MSAPGFAKIPSPSPKWFLLSQLIPVADSPGLHKATNTSNLVTLSSVLMSTHSIKSKKAGRVLPSPNNSSQELQRETGTGVPTYGSCNF